MASIFPTYTPGTNTGTNYTVGTTTYQWTGYAWIKVSETAQLENLTLKNLTATNSIVVTSSTNATSTTSGAFQVIGGVGIGKDLYLGGSLYFTSAAGAINASQVLVSSTANSTSTTTGALVVTGGVGIGQDVWIGGKVVISNTSTIDNADIVTTSTLARYIRPPIFVAGTGTAITTSTVDYQETVTIWNTGSTLQTVTDIGNSTTNQLLFLNTTNATNTTTGALVVSGGVAIGGDLWLGGTIYSGGVPVITTTTLVESFLAGDDIRIISTSSFTGQVLLINNTSTLQTVTTRGSTTTNAVHFANTTESTSSSTGAVIIDGGLGVAKRINSESLQIADTVMDSGLILVNTTATYVVDYYPIGQYRSAKYLIQIEDGSGISANFETIEILLLVDNAQTVYATEYAVLSSNGELGEFAADVQGDDVVRLYFTPFQVSDKILKIFRTGMVA